MDGGFLSRITGTIASAGSTFFLDASQRYAGRESPAIPAMEARPGWHGSIPLIGLLWIPTGFFSLPMREIIVSVWWICETEHPYRRWKQGTRYVDARSSPLDARFNIPAGLAYQDGRLYVADYANNAIREILLGRPIC